MKEKWLVIRKRDKVFLVLALIFGAVWGGFQWNEGRKDRLLKEHFRIENQKRADTLELEIKELLTLDSVRLEVRIAPSKKEVRHIGNPATKKFLTALLNNRINLPSKKSNVIGGVFIFHKEKKILSLGYFSGGVGVYFFDYKGYMFRIPENSLLQ